MLPQDAFGNRRLAGDDSLLVSASNGSANVSGFDASEGFYTVGAAAADAAEKLHACACLIGSAMAWCMVVLCCTGLG